jgi:hypothetical protein
MHAFSGDQLAACLAPVLWYFGSAVLFGVTLSALKEAIIELEYAQANARPCPISCNSITPSVWDC